MRTLIRIRIQPDSFNKNWSNLLKYFKYFCYEKNCVYKLHRYFGSESDLFREKKLRILLRAFWHPGSDQNTRIRIHNSELFQAIVWSSSDHWPLSGLSFSALVCLDRTLFYPCRVRFRKYFFPLIYFFTALSRVFYMMSLILTSTVKTLSLREFTYESQ